MKELTKAEEQVMQILWKIKEGFVKDFIEYFDEPKPAYNTISTIIRILENKGFIGHTAYGKTHKYFPIIAKDEYKKTFLKGFIRNYFENSFQQLVSFFSDNENLSIKELEELVKIVNEKISDKEK
jgi:predicted transcriptional regulator